MLTSKEQTGDIELANSKGAVDFIIKPFKLYEVPEIVQKHLEKVNKNSLGKKAGFFNKIFSNH
jgi:FixJ family two-component response regulator